MIPRRPRSPLFPYTTLFRSGKAGDEHAERGRYHVRIRRRRAVRRIERPAGVDAAAQSRHQRERAAEDVDVPDRKSTRLNSSHSQISYAVFCLKKKNMTS